MCTLREEATGRVFCRAPPGGPQRIDLRDFGPADAAASLNASYISKASGWGGLPSFSMQRGVTSLPDRD